VPLPEVRKPETIACAIFPAPINPTWTLLGSVSLVAAILIQSTAANGTGRKQKHLQLLTPAQLTKTLQQRVLGLAVLDIFHALFTNRVESLFYIDSS